MAQNIAQYVIEYRTDGIYLTVNPLPGIDKTGILNKVVQTLSSKGITEIDRQALMLVINNARGVSTKIAEREKGARIDASIKINVSSDKMRAFLTMFPPQGGYQLTRDRIMNFINSQGIFYGIDNELITRLGENPRYGESIEFANGQELKKGDNGRIELQFDVNADKKPKLLEDGSVDFRELNYIVSVKEGDVLARIVPPGNGEPGKNVFGQLIVAPKGKPAKNPRGKNVEITPDGTKVISKIDGYASFVDDKISVMNVLEIPGNVDISTGNIRFSGNVIVKGNVLTDFIIEAGGNVEVFGIVEGATIKADGDIILKRGIQGLHKGVLISGGDIIARFIEHCTISARSNIRSESIMHCEVNCGGEIELLGPKGLLVGGNIKVSKEIMAKTIGSPMSTPTNIQIGVDPVKREIYRSLRERFEEVNKERINAQKSIELLNKMSSNNTLRADKKILLSKLIQNNKALSEECKELQEQIEALEEEFSSVNHARIKVRKKIFPGVKVTIGSISKFINEEEEFVTIFLEGADIKTTPFQ